MVDTAVDDCAGWRVARVISDRSIARCQWKGHCCVGCGPSDLTISSATPACRTVSPPRPQRPSKAYPLNPQPPPTSLPMSAIRHIDGFQGGPTAAHPWDCRRGASGQSGRRVEEPAVEGGVP
jgi:hypothetical protein